MSDPFTDPNASPFGSGGRHPRSADAFRQQAFGHPSTPPFPDPEQWGQPPNSGGSSSSPGKIIVALAAVVVLAIGGIAIAVFAAGGGGGGVPDGQRLLEVTASIDSAGLTHEVGLEIGDTTTVQIDVLGRGGFDPVLVLYGPDRRFIAEDDDGGSRLNSRMRQTLAPGGYIIEVRGFGSSTGTFEVIVTRQ